MNNQKLNQHYVPQFWMRLFRGAGNHLYARMDGQVGQVSPEGIMAEERLYTIWNTRWQPMDWLEDALSKSEAQAAPVFRQLQMSGYAPTADDRHVLCKFLGLQACRHPDILNRGRRVAIEFLRYALCARKLPQEQFVALVVARGMAPSDAAVMHARIHELSDQQAAAQVNAVQNLSPQDPNLPLPEVIMAAPSVAKMIAEMELTLLDASAGSSFILGDTPLPQGDLAKGFSVPLGGKVAILAEPLAGNRSLTRRAAKQAEVDSINRTQFENSLKVVVGPDPNLLRAL
jgi:hypothetical protein